MAALFDFGLGNIDLWRSEEMQLVQLMVASDSAHDTLAALGDIGLLQFKDLNTDKSAFQRNYANQVKRCDEAMRKLRFFTEQVEKEGMKISPRTTSTRTLTLDELEAQLEELETEVLQLNSNSERLLRTRAELIELQLLLEHGAKFFDTARQQAVAQDGTSFIATNSTTDFSSPLLGDNESRGGFSDPKNGRLNFVAGLIAQEKVPAFERLLFRATRGNMLLRNAEVGTVQDPATGEKMNKSVFVVFSSGERARSKVMKICEAYGANRYPFPEEHVRRLQASAEVDSRLSELSATIGAGDMHRQGVMRTLAASLDEWITLARREKAIYHTLNKMSMDTSRKVLVGEAWVPNAARGQVTEVLRQAALASSDANVGTVVQPLSMHHENPPTYFRTNKFTEVFQNIVDAYGVARYREVNPAVWTVMTFPFLFAVMFGDFGHGILMLLFAAFLLVQEKKLSKMKLDDMSSMAFAGRYCILLMSLFSIYTGALYNECFSIPMMLAGNSRWTCSDPNITDLRDCHPPHQTKLLGGPYPFGVDPVWRGGLKELPFLNSVKMKLSIILGVGQMNLGILMSLFNNMYFRDRLSTWMEFVPQMIFLNALFGYLCILIIAKWVTGQTTDLYNVMIYMFLAPGDVKPAGHMFDGQAQLQMFLLLIAVVAVPWMLLPKPLILNARHKAARAGGIYAPLQGSAAEGDAEQQTSGGDEHGDHFEFGEVLVHQMIHTIEFVLGAVSNTASYLRLWALSLAHSQLSAVFYDRVLLAGLQANSTIGLFIGFFVWALATLSVLMVMESLSAFLHALRLHWVEFQNKFYRGDGYAFVPFCLRSAVQEEDS